MAFVPSIEPPALVPARRVWFVVSKAGLLVREQGGRVSLPGEADEAALGLAPGSSIYLGELDGAAAFASVLPEGTTPGPSLSSRSLRALFGPLDETVWSVAGRATQLCEWAETSRFCGRCGAATARAAGERCMKCPSCGLTAYPRIAPAIIVLIRRGDEALLARGARFPAAFYSTLAGFSEPGESLEETLSREVREEVGVEVKNPRYFGSQSWPFPHSLMIGFTAEWASGEIVVDPSEIVEAGWYRADALPMVPPKLSIARQLIDAWVDEVKAKGA